MHAIHFIDLQARIRSLHATLKMNEQLRIKVDQLANRRPLLWRWNDTPRNRFALADYWGRVTRELVRSRFPLSDGSENPSWLLRLAAESVAALHSQ